MNALRSLRILLLAMVAMLIPASSFGGVFISVNFAPPQLPVYEQPPCPDQGLIWMPGYWAYDQDGYYWVPGTWVQAPYEGALWTPPYWGWDNNLYVFHPGYWGLHVGYYGGVNYGFGYMGVGFVGGMWRGHDFIYNTAVMRVDERRVRNVYVDRDVVRRYTIENDRHVSFSGGRDGIHHDPRPEERFADRDRHVDETQFQRSHEDAARSDKSFYARNNGGHPSNVVVQRPMGTGPMQNNRGGFQGRDNGNQRPQGNTDNRGGNYDSRSNARGNDNRNTYTPPPNAGNQNRGNAPQQDNPRQGNSNARGFDNRNTYTPPTNAGNQNRGNTPQPGYQNPPQPGNQNPHYRNDAPQQNNPAPQFRNYNNPHGSQDNMQNRGGPPQQQQQRPQPQPQQQRQQPQPQQARPQQQPPQPHGDQGGHGDHGDHGHDRDH